MIEKYDTFESRAKEGAFKIDKYRIALSESLDTFKQQCLDKYDKGRAEHGDTLSELDFDKEIKEEIIDIVNYALLKQII